MNPRTRILYKYILNILNKVQAGLSSETLLDQAESLLGGPKLTTVERQEALQTLVEKEWLYTYKDTFLDETLYAITGQGRAVCASL